MKRRNKNIICILLVVLLIVSVIFTALYEKNNLSTTSNNINQMGNNGGMNTPPDMENSGSENTPPDKPDSDNDSSMNGENNSLSSDGNTPPDKPDGETTMDNQMIQSNTEDNSNINVIYYVIISGEILLLSLTILYLLMSKFNKYNLKETLYKDKVLIYILASLICASILTVATIFIINKYLISNTDNLDKGIQNNSSNSQNITYSSNNQITTDSELENETYESTTADENALLINGDITVSADNIVVNKTGDSSGGDNTSFYGINSAILAKNGAKLTLKNIEVTTNATGANGVFSYGGSATTNNQNSDGTEINISDSKITTLKDNSGGIMTTGGGTTNATNLTITTSGTSSAAIRSDRGGGVVNVTGGVYKTTGQGSPAIYSTANISIKDAELISTASEGIVIEGKNSVTLDNVKLTDSNTKLNGQSTTYKNIFLYQSMSGDADTGVSNFTAKNSTITTNNGDSFYVTNTTATINLTNNKIINNDSTGNFLRAKSDSWGNSNSNGGIVTLNMNNQEVSGNIVIDSLSTLDMTMSSSTYEGVINGENSAKDIKITLDKSSKIKLTGDSYITSLDDEDTTYSNIDLNGYTLYVNGTKLK